MRLLFIACLVPVLYSCHPFKTPEIREPHVITVHILRWVNNNQPVIRIESHCYNPNAVGFDFKGGELDMYLDSFYLGRAVVDTPFHVAAHSNFMVPLQLQLDLVRLLKNGLQLEKEDTVKVDGRMKGTSVGITKTLPIHYQGVHKLAIDMKPF